MRFLTILVLALMIAACGSRQPPAETNATDAVQGTATQSPTVDPAEVEIDQSIDRILGNHAAYRDLFDRLQQAVARDDADAVAALVSYPIEVSIDGETRTLADVEAFVRQYREIIDDEIRSAIESQRYADVLVNWQGVMLGDGQVWLNGVCVDSACTESLPRVVMLQNVRSAAETGLATDGPTQTPAVHVELQVSDAVQALLDAGESLIVSADYFGTPAPASQLPADLQGQPWLSVARVQIEREAAGQVLLPPSAFDQDMLEYTEPGSLGLNINVFSGRRTDPDNLVDCDFFQDTWEVAATAPIDITCRRLEQDQP